MQGVLPSHCDSRARGLQMRFLGVLVGLATMAAVFAMPSPASAVSASFNCGALPVNSWCEYLENHSWTLVSAQWGTGASAAAMCAKIVNSADQDNGTRNCATGTVVYSISQPAYVGPNTWADVANGDSGGNKTINGWATT